MKKTPGLPLQSIVSWNAVKCTRPSSPSSVILSATLGYNHDKFSFGMFGDRFLGKELVESLTVNFLNDQIDYL